MHSDRYPVIASTIVAIGALMLGTPARATIQTGTLACNVGGGPGLIIGSARPLNCTFTGPTGAEHYIGSIVKLGADVGYLAAGQMVWTVVAATADPGPGSLAGSYGGVTAGVTAGAGVGASVLVGGSDRSFTLQPVSLEGQTGFDVSGGLVTVNLQYAR